MGKPVEKKRKKKGRPSLLDLQKRSLRLQKLQEDQRQPKSQNPSPNPYIRFPNSVPIRRNTRRADAEEAAEDGEDEEEQGNGKRREKKLKLVLRLHQNNGATMSEDPREGISNSDSSGSESKNDDDAARKEKTIDAVLNNGSGLEKTEVCDSSTKATEAGELSAPGLTTPLPDKKLLLFILDRLQKKDTYGVYSEPVDPNELPDYFDVIKHPMDFSTVRKRLSSGHYRNLEMFEKDVFLICTNAMSYNAPDTIYFRQARSIHELAKKDFDNLRQDSEDEDAEPRVRRGRPPAKSWMKKMGGRSPGDRANVDFSDATLANAGESHLTWSNSTHDNSHRMVNGEGSALERFDEPGSSGRGVAGRMWKKVVVQDENRRHTYIQPLSLKGWYEPPVLAALDGERRQLVPVGLHGEYAYARSLARFAAKLGPLAWKIAATQIEKALPPGTKFGRGWVGEPDTPQQNISTPLSTTPSISAPGTSPLFQMQQQNDSMPFGGMSHAVALEMVSKGAAAALTAAKDSPPDLNVKFQSPGSPPLNGSGVGDSQQPDLVLQL